jgi:hypothetical protein
MRSMASHKCPVPGCRVQIPGNLLMCRAHWQQLPAELQARVYATYWEHNRKPNDEELLKAHRANCREAIEVCRGRRA